MNRYTDSVRWVRAAWVAGIGLLGACGAYAQAKGNFDEADANHDGKVTLQEYQTYATQRLNASDGRLARRFKKLSPEDQSQRLQKRFNKLDHDHKGYLDRKDWSGS